MSIREDVEQHATQRVKTQQQLRQLTAKAQLRQGGVVLQHAGDGATALEAKARVR